MAGDMPDYRDRVSPTIGIGETIAPVPTAPIFGGPSLAAPVAATATAEALTGLGNELLQVTSKLQDGMQHTIASEGMASFLTKRDDLAQKYAQDPDYQNAETNFKTDLADVQRQSLEGISDPRLRAQSSLQMTRSAIEATGTVRGAQLVRQQGINTAALDENELRSRNEAIAASSPMARDETIRRYFDQIDGSVAVGWMDAASAEKRKIKFNTSLQTADAMGAIQRNPGQAAVALADPANFPALDPVTRQQFITAASEKDETNRTAQLQQIAKFEPARAMAAVGRVGSMEGAKRIFSDGIVPIESNGDNAAVSSAGALGAAQIMPATAREVATKLGLSDIAKLSDADLKARLLADKDLNLRLGSTYFQQMVTRYDGNIPVAAAAYNGGPGRADAWRDQAVAKFGENFTPAQLASVIDVKESRDYVGKLYAKLGAPMDAAFSSAAATGRAINAVDASVQAQTARERSVLSTIATTQAQTNDVNVRLKAGYDVAPAEIEAFKTSQGNAAAAGDDTAAGRLRDLNFSLAMQPLVRQAWNMPPAQLDAAVQIMNANFTAPGANPSMQQIRQRDALQTVRDEQVKTRDTEPVVLGGENGGRFYRLLPINPQASLDDGLLDSLRARDSQALHAKQVYGGSGSPFTKEETAGFAQRYADAAPADRAAIVGTLARGLSPSTFAAALPVVTGGTKADAPALTMAAGLYGASPEVAQGIVEGISAAKVDDRYTPGKGANKLSYQTDKDSYLPAQAFNRAGRTDPAGPYAAMSDAIDARYAYLSAQARDVSGSANRSRLKQAVDDVTGGILQFNGAPVIAPVRGMTQQNFDATVWSIADSDLQGAQTTSGKPITAEFLRSGTKLQARSDGQYYLQVNRNDAAPQFAVTPTGAPFVLDLRNRPKPVTSSVTVDPFALSGALP